jgi:hypothetical protein
LAFRVLLAPRRLTLRERAARRMEIIAKKQVDLPGQRWLLKHSFTLGMRA